MDATALLSRADLASHLRVSVRSVDRFIARHRLRSGPGRAVLVREERYAWCLLGLRRQSTRSPAPDVRRLPPAPAPVRPGQELVLVAASDRFAAAHPVRAIVPGCRVRTLDQCPGEHWIWSWLRAAEAMAGVREAIGPGAARPEPAGARPASRYLRQFLREAHASTAPALDASGLARCLRRLPAAERRLLLEALSGEVADSARAAASAPLDYAREPLLAEQEVAVAVRRTLATVRRWRVQGAGPVFVKIERAVRYSRVDVNHWLAQRPVP